MRTRKMIVGALIALMPLTITACGDDDSDDDASSDAEVTTTVVDE